MKFLADRLLKYVPLNDKEYQAFCEIDRKYFMPEGFEFKAYDITAIPLSESSTISSPLTIAKMTHYLKLDGVDSVLEIGCGSGYQAAILSKLVRRVFTIDRICSLVKKAKVRFEKLGLYNINVKCDDGRFGWKSYAPYDRILISACVDKLNTSLFSQLKENGFILAPIKFENSQLIVRFYKNGKTEVLDKCNFVFLQEGVKK